MDIDILWVTSLSFNLFSMDILILAWCIVPLVMWWGWYLTLRLHYLDRPWPDVPQRSPVPTVLWVWAIVSFVLVILVYYGIDYVLQYPYVQWLLYGVLMIWWLALWDEMLEIRSKNMAVKWDKTKGISIISPKIKALIQCIIVCSALVLGDVSIPEFIFWSTVIHFPPWLAYWIASIWCVWFINAVNRFDGVYGLVSGISSIGFLTLYILVSVVVMWSYDLTPAYHQILSFVAHSAWVLTLISLISLYIEYKPLWVLRDVGTMFFGFALAYLSLLWGAKIWTMMVVLSLVLFDAVRVLWNRRLKHKNLFGWDYTHLHHRLLANGWSRWEIRVCIWSWSIFFMILILIQGTDRLNKLIIFVLMMLIFFGVNMYLFWIKKIPDHLKLSHRKPN